MGLLENSSMPKICGYQLGLPFNQRNKWGFPLAEETRGSPKDNAQVDHEAMQPFIYRKWTGPGRGLRLSCPKDPRRWTWKRSSPKGGNQKIKRLALGKLNCRNPSGGDRKHANTARSSMRTALRREAALSRD